METGQEDVHGGWGVLGPGALGELSCPLVPQWHIHAGGSEQEPGCPRQGLTGWRMGQGPQGAGLGKAAGAWGGWRAGANGQVLRPAGLGRPLLEERGSAQLPSSKGGPPTHTLGRKAQTGEGLPQHPISANLGCRDAAVTASRLGRQGGKGPGAPSVCARSPGWPGCPEAVNRLHSSWTGMEMRLPDRGALSRGRKAASSWACGGSPPPARPTLLGPRELARQRLARGTSARHRG